MTSTVCQAHSLPRTLQRRIGLGAEATSALVSCADLSHCPQVRSCPTQTCLPCHRLLAWHGYSNSRLTCHPGTLLFLSTVLGQRALRALPNPSLFPLHSVGVLPPTPWRPQFPFLGHNARNLDFSGWFLKLFKKKQKRDRNCW